MISEASSSTAPLSAPPRSRTVGPSQAAGTALLGERELTVRGDLLRHFMCESRYRQFVISIIKLSIVIFCWDYVGLTPLLAWFAFGVLAVALRMQIESRFAHPGAFHTAEAQAAFVRAMKPIYALHALVWGSSVLLFANRLPTLDQFACGLLMASVAAIPLRSAAMIPPLLRIYMDTLFATVVACLIAVASTAMPSELRTHAVADSDHLSHAMLLAVPVFHWWLLRSFGAHVHANQRGQYELQYDLAQKELEARALAEARIRFMTAAAHDLRQPTTALSIYADQLLECPQDHLALAPRIARASNAVNHLFNSLFDMATLDSGRVMLHVEPVRILHVLHDLRDQFEATARAKSIELQVRSDDVMVDTDPVQLRRMVGNVICNAIKYSPPDTRIGVVAQSTGSGVRIEVTDQGFGIPEADLGKVFDEFYRVEAHGRPAEEGVGLGLSIVTRLAQLLGCTLALHSVVGQGTRVSFGLPRTRPDGR